MYTYDDYDEEVINESALDMAIDMSDRYGVAVEDAYDFALEKVDPDHIWLNTYGVRKKYSDPYRDQISNHKIKRDKFIRNAQEYKEALYNPNKRAPGLTRDWHVKAANSASRAAYNQGKMIKELEKDRADFYDRLRNAKGRKMYGDGSFVDVTYR